MFLFRFGGGGTLGRKEWIVLLLWSSLSLRVRKLRAEREREPFATSSIHKIGRDHGHGLEREKTKKKEKRGKRRKQKKRERRAGFEQETWGNQLDTQRARQPHSCLERGEISGRLDLASK